MTAEKSYKIKIGTAQVGCRLDAIDDVLNADTLASAPGTCVERHEVARCVLRFDRPLAFDIDGSVPDTGRFVLVDGYEIAGGGIITGVADEGDMSRQLLRRDIKWIRSGLTSFERARYYKQKALLVVITGKTDTDKKSVARDLEKALLNKGHIAYYLGIGNVLYGLDADIKSEASMRNTPERQEHIRRLGELANIMLDAGNILIVTANELNFDELDTLRQIASGEHVLTVWIGGGDNSIRDFDLCLEEDAQDRVERLLAAIDIDPEA